MKTTIFTKAEKDFLAAALPIFESLGEVTVKKTLLGGKKIMINGVKIGGLIKDQSTGYILQLKPTKKGEKVLLSFSQKYQERLPCAGGTPNFTLIRLDHTEFLQSLICDTYNELTAVTSNKK